MRIPLLAVLPVLLAAAPAQALGPPAIGRGVDGTVAVAEDLGFTATGPEVGVHVRRPGDAWRTTVLPDAGRVAGLDVAVEPSGAVRVTWSGDRYDLAQPTPAGESAVQSQVLAPDGTAGPRELVPSAATEVARLGHGPDGQVVAAWSGGAAAAGPGVALHAIGGALVPCGPKLAVARGGTAVAVGQCGDADLVVATRSPGGDFDRSEAVPGRAAGDAAVALSDGGDTTVVTPAPALRAFRRAAGEATFGPPVELSGRYPVANLHVATEGGASLVTWSSASGPRQTRLPATGDPVVAPLGEPVTGLVADADGRVAGAADNGVATGTVADGLTAAVPLPDADATRPAVLPGAAPAAAWLSPGDARSAPRIRFADPLGAAEPPETLATGQTPPPTTSEPRRRKRVRIAPGPLRREGRRLLIPIDCRHRRCVGAVRVAGRRARFDVLADTGDWASVRAPRTRGRVTVTLRSGRVRQRVRRRTTRDWPRCGVVPWARLAARAGATRLYTQDTSDDEAQTVGGYGVFHSVIACRGGRTTTVVSVPSDFDNTDVILPAVSRDWGAAIEYDGGDPRDPGPTYTLVRTQLPGGREHRLTLSADFGLRVEPEPRRLLVADGGTAVVVETVGERVRLRAVADGSDRILDAGPGIDAASVTLGGRTLRWTRDGVQRQAQV